MIITNEVRQGHASSPRPDDHRRSKLQKAADKQTGRGVQHTPLYAHVKMHSVFVGVHARDKT